MVRGSVALLVGLVVASVASAAAPKPAIELRIKAVKDLVPIIKYIGEVAHQAEPADQIAGVIQELAKDEDGIYGTRADLPIGAYIAFGETIETSPIVLMLPVVSEKAVLDNIGDKLNIDPKKGEDGAYSLDVPNVPYTVYFRVNDGYLYATIRSAKGVEKGNLIAPKVFFTAKDAPVVGLTANIAEWPADIKKTLLGQVEMQWMNTLQGLQPSATQKLLNQFLVDISMNALKTTLADGKTLNIALDATPKSDDITLGLSLSATGSDTALAKALAGFADRDVLPGQLLAGSNHFGLQFLVPPEAKKMLVQLKGDLVEAAGKNVPDGTKAGYELVGTLFAPLLESGDIQLSVAADTSAKPGQVQVQSAFKLDDGDQLRGLLQILGVGIPKTAAKFTPTVAKVNNRKLHKIDVFDMASSPLDVGTVWVATSEDYALAATSPKDSGIRTLMSAKPKSAKMLDVKVSFAELYPVVNPGKTTGTMTAGKDTLTITGQGGTEFKLNAALKGSVLKFYTAER